MLTTSEFRDKYSVARDTFFKYRKEVESTTGRDIGTRQGNSINLSEEEVRLLLEAIPTHLWTKPELDQPEQVSIVPVEVMEDAPRKLVPVRKFEIQDRSEQHRQQLEITALNVDQSVRNGNALDDAYIQSKRQEGIELAARGTREKYTAMTEAQEDFDAWFAERLGLMGKPAADPTASSSQSPLESASQ